MIENISTGAERTAKIVKSLCTFSRLDEADKKLADIHESIDSTLALLHYKINDAITINKKYGEIPPVVCYPGKLNQVFINLLVNAIDAINNKDVHNTKDNITIKTYMTEKDTNKIMAIAISDTGLGIAETAKGHLFGPFFTTKDVGEGTGLGLAISLGIIKDHRGSIEFESEVNKGTTFTVYLPLAV
ncbi:MAG: HAMP domain-containing histidine kinase [Bacteroidetes bacterium]|nr:HAMP domain-containing histidine kinase [Bacteroidota bacterium]